MIEVRKPGLSTTVQDGGRVGYYDVGIPPSGALDQYASVSLGLAARLRICSTGESPSYRAAPE